MRRLHRSERGPDHPSRDHPCRCDEPKDEVHGMSRWSSCRTTASVALRCKVGMPADSTSSGTGSRSGRCTMLPDDQRSSRHRPNPACKCNRRPTGSRHPASSACSNLHGVPAQSLRTDPRWRFPPRILHRGATAERRPCPSLQSPRRCRNSPRPASALDGGGPCL